MDEIDEMYERNGVDEIGYSMEHPNSAGLP
jgi:hypothetical protein